MRSWRWSECLSTWSVRFAEVVEKVANVVRKVTNVVGKVAKVVGDVGDGLHTTTAEDVEAQGLL